MEHEYDGVKCHCDDEIQQREEVKRQVAKAAGECDGWRKKFEQDALVRIEELESTKVGLGGICLHFSRPEYYFSPSCVRLTV